MANALKTLFTDIATAIRETLPDIGKMSPYSYPDNIRAVAAAGGGSSDLVKYVTFMSEDGTIELYKMPVLVGDDCKDPVTRSDIETPTKESTNTQNFTYSGWSLSKGGSADSSALENITEDTIVYVSFTASVRYYTVEFYSDDALEKTVQVTYGSDATELYTPEKDGYKFNGWSVDVSNVTSNITTQAVWVIDDGIIRDDWATVAANANSYKVGDKKEVTFTYADGSTETVYYRVVAKNVEEKKDGTPGVLTFMPDNLVYNAIKLASSSSEDSGEFYSNDTLKSTLELLLAALPTDLAEIIQPVKKDIDLFTGKYQYRKLFNPSAINVKGSTSGQEFEQFPEVEYEYFSAGNTSARTKLNNNTADDYWVNTLSRITSVAIFFKYVDNGVISSESNACNESHYLLPCFCVG